jgi:hypothetical protein
MFKFKAGNGFPPYFLVHFSTFAISSFSLKMKIIRVVLILSIFCSLNVSAQSPARVTSGVDLGLGYQDNIWVPAITYHQELSLANFSWLRFGWGVRTWGYYAGKTNLIPKETSYSNDYLKYGKITTNGLSILAGLNFRFGNFDIGGNTDLVGLAIGAKRNGLYTKDYAFEGDEAGSYNKLVRSSPSLLNVLPVALENQNGQSELYIRYWISTTIGVKLGYVIGRTTYTTSEKLDNDQDRFSKTYAVPSLSISFPLYN